MARASAVQGLKYRWLLPNNDKKVVNELAAKFNVSSPLINVLLTRGYREPDAIEKFIFTDAQSNVSNPALMKDADKAADRLIAAINNKEKILICGDYDVDGITSSALVLMCMLPLGADINFFLPNRARDGYGLAVKTVERAAKNNYAIIITVDNGTTAFEPARKAKELGIDLIITDHHKPHHELPEAFAFVNPHQADCTYPFKSFAGVGVSFKLMSLVYEKLNKSLPDTVYELLMLGTIADVVPLLNENRYWVRHGLRRQNVFASTAFNTLKKNGRLTKPLLSSQDIGFMVAPQINALGRLDDPRDGVTFLMSSDAAEVARIGTILAQLNEARKLVERSILRDIEAELATKDMVRERVVVASSNSWPSGVIGLAASRLVGAYGRPAFLFHLTSEGVAKGSCRSIPSFNLFNALEQVSDMLISFGGHAMAAGLALPAHKLPEFKERMSAIVDEQLTADDLVPTLQMDAHLSLQDVTMKMVNDLEYLEPFGCENSVPLFYLRNVSLVGEVQLLKEAHTKCLVFSEGVMKPVIFFSRPDIYNKLMSNPAGVWDMAVQVTQNYWNNEVRVELQGLDVLAHE